MVRHREEVLKKLKETRADLKQKYSVVRIGVFGSFAKDESTVESDVDILVELGEPTFDNYMDLKFKLEDMLGRDVDLVLADTVKPRLKPIIDREVRYA